MFILIESPITHIHRKAEAVLNHDKKRVPKISTGEIEDS